MIAVAVFEDDPLVRAGVVALLGSQPDLDVVADHPDGHRAAEVVQQSRPDVVVMDLRMPGCGGIEATRAICAAPDAPPVLVLTTFDGDPDVVEALRAGASGYVLKRNPDDLAPALRRIHLGETWIDPAVAGQVLSALAALPRPGAPSALVSVLTAREREVLALLAQGLSNAEMAERLYLGVGTVKTHMSRILFKTGCRDRAQATVLAFTSGLVTVH